MANNPYTTFPRQVIYSLAEYVTTAQVLSSRAESIPVDADRVQDHINFMLCGQHTENEHQAVIDPLREADLLPEDSILTTRDYDSVIGIANNILVQSEIYIFPLGDPFHTLTTSIHMRYPIRKQDVRRFVPSIA